MDRRDVRRIGLLGPRSGRGLTRSRPSTERTCRDPVRRPQSNNRGSPAAWDTRGATVESWPEVRRPCGREPCTGRIGARRLLGWLSERWPTVVQPGRTFAHTRDGTRDRGCWTWSRGRSKQAFKDSPAMRPRDLDQASCLAPLNDISSQGREVLDDLVDGVVVVAERDDGHLVHTQPTQCQEFVRELGVRAS